MRPTTKRDLEGFARSVRSSLGIDDQLRPDILSVIEKLAEHGYITSYAALPDQRMPDAEAEFNSDKKRLCLRQSTLSALKKGDPRARWTVVHELGHAVLGHRGINRRSTTKQARYPDHAAEKEANLFAAAFLAPRHLMGPSAEATAEQITTRFNISAAAARIRLRDLNQQIPRASSKEPQPSVPANLGEELYGQIKESLEKDHRGSYVMINLATGEHVIDRTMSAVHERFITTFGEDAPGWSTRIGISAFAAA